MNRFISAVDNNMWLSGWKDALTTRKSLVRLQDRLIINEFKSIVDVAQCYEQWS